MVKDSCTEEQFLNSVAEHEMTIVRDDGIYREILFKKPGTGNMHFRINTWHGYLCYSGDMGTYVFRRLNDMFEFFRTKPEGTGLYINLGYWAEKCCAADRDGIKEYCPDTFEEQIKSWLDDIEASPELRESAEEDVLSRSHDGEHQAKNSAIEFEHNGKIVFRDFWECDLRVYTYRFIWCCYAMVWGIQKYDALKVAPTDAPKVDG